MLRRLFLGLALIGAFASLGSFTRHPAVVEASPANQLATISFADHGDGSGEEIYFRRGEGAVYANVELLEEVRAPAEAAAYGPVEDTAAVKYRTPQGDVMFALLTADGLLVCVYKYVWLSNTYFRTLHPFKQEFTYGKFRVFLF